MIWEVTPQAIAALFGGIMLLIAAVAMRQRDDRLASFIGMLLLLSAAVWLLAHGLELVSAMTPASLFWNRFQYVGVTSVPVLWSAYILLYAGQRQWLKPGILLLIGGISLLAMGLALTNDYHGLMWTESTRASGGSYYLVEKTWGPAFWAFIVYAYLLVLVAIARLTLAVFRSHRLYRWQGIALVVAAMLPIAGSILDVANVQLLAGVDLSAFSFAISGPIVAWGVPRLRLGDIVPVARDRAVDSMSDAVLILDPTGHVADLNPAAANLLGCSRSGASGRHLIELWPEWDAAQQIWPEGGRNVQITVGSGSSLRYFDMRNTPVRDWQDQLMSEVVVLRDITDRVQAERALSESEERYRLHFENISEVVYSIDRQLKVLSVSPSVERHLGYKPEELVGKPIQDVNILAPEYWAAALSDIARVFSGEQIAASVFEFVTKDGRRKIAEVSGSPLIQDGKIVAVVSVARDVTDRVKADEQIKASLLEKEVLLKEIHHRVKNNLQVISSLLTHDQPAGDSCVQLQLDWFRLHG